MKRVEVFGIAGPAGAGRSTVAAMVMSLLEPAALVSAGEVDVFEPWLDALTGGDQSSGVKAVVFDGIADDRAAEQIRAAGGRVLHVTRPGVAGGQALSHELIDALLINHKCKGNLWREVNMTLRGFARVS